MTTPSHTRLTRVAGSQPGFIGKADALPITHNTSQADSGQTASTSCRVHQAPLSFTANHRRAAGLVAAMVAVVLTMSAVAVAVVLGDAPARSWIVAVTIGGLVAFGGLLTAPAVLAARSIRSEIAADCDEDTVVLGDGFWSIDDDMHR